MLLGIDSCGGVGSVALAAWEGGEARLLQMRELAGKTFASDLIPVVRELLAEQGAVVGDVQAIVVVRGPGSFTGERIGLSTAKGLAEALDVPVVALSRLALLARKGGTAAAALDAGRREMYWGDFSGPGRQEEAERLLAVSDAPAAGQVAVCEDALAELPGAVRVTAPTAWDAIEASLARLQADDYEDVASLDANYVRRSDAELFGKPVRAGLEHPPAGA
ncbi:tRNA (adenosine(37)-N6)-threonylcarbamoyltransferase complex dimerization subunit type 1 TsaB [Silvibacterium dinghuense]|nr:tRNA (adenosine(37)-N6)-threonylcarbamoyltransferase complex dimerization subunit type 1 TsaB [Silvibacterium dinghuense]GGG94068.1 hypothetical protein GCM10011586_06140 [Silvibacterium dinghuense]